jgi:hypothetical protein
MRLSVVEVADLRCAALSGYEAAQPLPPGASSLFGPEVPFGTPAFAARDAADLTPASVQAPAQPIAGWRASGSLWPAERFMVRVPERWNGRLIVAGTPSQRSEFACDRFFADPLLARGYAYVSGNKGLGDGAVLLAPGATFAVDGTVLPRFALSDGRSISFWQHARGSRIERWLEEFLAIAAAAQEIVTDLHGTGPELTYAIGLSNGGYEVRRAIEESDAFAGALTWNAIVWTPEHNVLRGLPEAIAAMEAGEPQRLESLGFPHDVPARSGNGSLYAKNLAVYWYLSAWLHAVHLDPESSLPYGDVNDPAAAEAWSGKMGAWRFDRSPRIAERVAAFSNTGRIRCKLIDLASEYDHLVPPLIHFVEYGRLVSAAGKGNLYRGELMPDAQHVDSWSEDPEYPQMRPGYPRVMKAFDELVTWVEG